MIDIYDEVNRIWAAVRDERERADDLIQQLAESGASDEVVAAAAIMAEIRRYPWAAAPYPGAKPLGATEHDLGRAAVEALRRAGRLREAS